MDFRPFSGFRGRVTGEHPPQKAGYSSGGARMKTSPTERIRPIVRLNHVDAVAYRKTSGATTMALVGTSSSSWALQARRPHHAPVVQGQPGPGTARLQGLHQGCIVAGLAAVATASRRRTALARAASAEAEEGVPRRVALGLPWDRDVYGASVVTLVEKGGQTLIVTYCHIWL
eukprot:symbB.v1.2.011384.t1/scaffold760.1/size164708/5